ncbi:Rz1-like lysis system protein LysC [Erwinia sp. SLM-02]|uniref:Rz1-like lysis system protein LysC n=1 Tax=Erwinia sp. SLM-02 TaxID=3020057 RepID=UPI003080263C
MFPVVEFCLNQGRKHPAHCDEVAVYGGWLNAITSSLCAILRYQAFGDLERTWVIRSLELALSACALKVETIKDCQDNTDAEYEEPAQGAH